MSNIGTWSSITTWNLVLPPSRPDIWQLEIIQEYLEKKDNITAIAVLGSTVEFRDLLSDIGAKNIYVFEKNKEYYAKTNSYRVYDNEEKTIWGDWLNTIKRYDRCFDIILSDLTSGNIKYEDRDIFYKSISSALKEDGIFIDRILTNPDGLLDINELINKYNKLPINLKTVNDFNCEAVFCSSLLSEPKILDTTKIYQFLLGLKDPRITKFVESCYDITPRKCIWWYGIDWEEEKKTYNNYLDTLKVYEEPNNSAYHGRCKLFINKKRVQK